MNSAIKRSGSMGMGIIFAFLLMIFPGNTLSADAAELTSFKLPVSYFNQYSQKATDNNDDIKNLTNITLTSSTNVLQKGTVITITGVPEDSIYFQEDDNYTVTIYEGQDISTVYGGWYDGLEYDNGTIVYTIQTDIDYLGISFGDWQTKFSSGRDAYYLISADGSVVEK